MDLQTVQKITELERKVEATSPPEKPIDLISPFLALPGLRGFWPMSAINYTNPQVKDLGVGYSLTNNNTATFGYDPSRILVPCAFFDGVNQYLSRADGGAANWADITGTETYIENTAVSARGLACGGWFYADTTTVAMTCIAKGTTAAWAYSIRIRGDAADQAQFQINTAAVSATGAAVSDDTWTFLVGRFVPGLSVDVFRNLTKTSQATAVASLNDVAGAFCIGAFADPVQYLAGRASLCFLCATALSDAQISSLFQQTRGAFGV